MTISRVRRCGLGVLVLVGALALASCGSEGPAGSASLPPVDTASPSTQPSGPVAPAEIVGVYEDVEFYPACGNEALHHEGVSWYILGRGTVPVDHWLRDRLDEVLAVERAPWPDSEAQGLARVAPPGPGDDVGTLVVWDDGVARWVSDSGDLDVWLIDDELVHQWVC